MKLNKELLDSDPIELKLFYSSYVSPSFSDDQMFAKIKIDNIQTKKVATQHKSSNGLVQIEGNIENSKAFLRFPPNRLINESTGEVTYDYVSEEQKKQWPEPQLKKDADPPKKKQKEIVKPEPKPEYGETINIRKKKSLWERIIDRIIKNIVWGK